MEKPETFVSEIINCGIYIFSPAALFKLMGEIIQKNYQKMRYAVVISSCLSSIIGMPVDIFWKEQPYVVLQHGQIPLHCGKRGRVGNPEIEILSPFHLPLVRSALSSSAIIEKCCTFMSTLCFYFQFPAWWFISCLFALCPLSFALLSCSVSKV